MTIQIITPKWLTRLFQESGKAGSEVKSLIKRILPPSVKGLVSVFVTRWGNERQRRLTHVANQRAQRKYEVLSLAETFERIYASGAWGRNGDARLSSGVGSTGRYVEDYCRMLEQALKRHHVQSVADLGCGNFNTGQVIARLVTHYIGVDIVQSVIDANTKAYGTESIRFVRADMTRESLPMAQAAVVRQVLQHLSNAEIHCALLNILRTYRLAFITEHVYIGKDSTPNLDLGHGPRTRVPMRSGVFIDQRPFGLRAVALADIPYAPDEVLRTWSVLGTAEHTSIVDGERTMAKSRNSGRQKQ